VIGIATVRQAQCTWSFLAVLAACCTGLVAKGQAQILAPPAGVSVEAQAAPSAPAQNAPAESTPPEVGAPTEQGDQSIRDPELDAAQGTTEPSVASGEEVIADPELQTLAKPAAASGPPPDPNGQIHVLLRSRVGMDTVWQDPLEDVWEATQIAVFEARVRRSEHLRFEVGLRVRYMFASRAHATTDADATRYELDLAPTAAYADITLSDGLHLRIGEQGVRLGRFDALNASDILSTYDFRSGPLTMPEAGEIAQPAVRLDWDASSWLSFSGTMLPFYQPHVVRAFEGDYALTRLRRVDVDSISYAVANSLFSDPTLARAAVQNGRTILRNTLARTAQGDLAESVATAFLAPRMNLASPQVALRTTAHGPAGEIGLTLGSALEHLPAMWFSQAFKDYLCASSAAGSTASPSIASPTCPVSLSEATTALASDPHPIMTRVDRYELVSFDAATALGPLQLGAELAYMFHRTEVSAARPEDSVLSTSLPEHTDIAHAGLRVEWVHSDTLVIAVETSADYALQAPSDPKRHYLFLTDQRWFLAALGFVTITPFDIGLSFDLSGGILNGPSYVLFPRLEQRVVDRLYVEAGAALVTGRKYPMTDPHITLGGVYSDTNQVFLGLRWVP
jgi:hypothetical protein